MTLAPLDILLVVKILIYVPTLFLAFRISRKYSPKERTWIFLFLFSLIRIIGCVLGLIFDLNFYNHWFGLSIGYYTLEMSDFSLLLLCTFGLLEIIAEGPRRKHFRKFRILAVYFLGIVAMGFIIPGVALGNGLFLFTGACLYGVMWAFLATAIVVLWFMYSRLLEHRRKLLTTVSIALPFLAVRVVYTVLSVLSQADVAITGHRGSSIIQFNMFGGTWQIYLGMDVAMEYAVVIIYTVAGIMLPLDKDYERREIDEFSAQRRFEVAS